MVEIRLLYPKDKYESALRLAEALEAAGYEVEREALALSGALPDVAAEAGKAKALLLIWSRGLVSAAMAGPGLALARRNPNLIEISADGIEPAGAEASPVILLCGWRGQPYHQGWQRILAEVKRLCGAREASGTGPRPSPVGASVRGVAGASAARRLPVRAAVAAGALVAAALGAGILYDRGQGDARPDRENRPVAAAVEPPSAAASARAAAVSASPAPNASAVRSQADDAPSAAGASSVMPPPAAGRAAPVRPTAAQTRSGRERLAAASRGEVKRYSRKHSKTMRLFCQRSGRSTPQCRTFARSMRDLDG